MNAYGKYTLEEMYTVVRRRVDTYRAEVNPLTGVEGNITQLDPLVTNEDIKMYLNAALAKRHIDVSAYDNTIFADEQRIDIVANQVEYELPEDLLFLRALYYKPPGVTYSEMPPNERVFMYEQDQENDINILYWNRPTYRRRLNTIVLNGVPTENNQGGLVVDYVKSHLALVVDDQTLEGPLATIMQEVIILDAAIYIVTEKLQLVANELRKSLTDMESRLMLAVTNYHAPKVVAMVNPIPLAYPPVGRRNRTWVGRFGRFWW